MSLVMVLLVGFAALWGIGGVEHVQLQHEATQEVAWGLEALATPSWFYTRVGHIGYPGRQYLIVAAPSLVLGRGLVGLRLGFALVFLFGVLLFWSGARAAWGDRLRGHDAAAMAALSVVAFPYAVKHLHWYEQTTLPLAFTLAAAGWLMITLRRPTVLNWLGLAWIGALLGTSYTPALGSWGTAARRPAVVGRVCLAKRRPRRRREPTRRGGDGGRLRRAELPDPGRPHSRSPARP